MLESVFVLVSWNNVGGLDRLAGFLVLGSVYATSRERSVCGSNGGFRVVEIGEQVDRSVVASCLYGERYRVSIVQAPNTKERSSLGMTDATHGVTASWPGSSLAL